MTNRPDAEGSGTLPAGTRIGRTALQVDSLDEMTEFYSDIVGLSVLRRSGSTTILGVADTPLLVLEGVERVATRTRTAAGLYHNAFRVPSRGALGDALARIREGWRLDGASDHWVSEALYLTDPEGNGVEIYRDYPREEWPTADDGTVQISTEPLDLDSIAAVASGDDRAPPGTDVGHVHLEVTSLDAFREFYVDTIGFEEQTAVPSASFVSAGGYHHHLGANTWHQRTTQSGGRGLSWFEIVVPDQGTLDALRERLRKRDTPISESEDGITVSDPDGITIRFRNGPA
jgi:catechol 2,3-dioxygenase